MRRIASFWSIWDAAAPAAEPASCPTACSTRAGARLLAAEWAVDDRDADRALDQLAGVEEVKPAEEVKTEEVVTDPKPVEAAAAEVVTEEKPAEEVKPEPAAAAAPASACVFAAFFDAFDAILATGHQSIEISTTDIGVLGTKCDRCKNIGTMHDSSINVNLVILLKLLLNIT